MVRRVTRQRTPTLTVHNAPIKNRNWRSHVKVKYFKTKKYVQGTLQRTLTTGILESDNKQFRFNIWSDKAIKVEELEQNKIYTIQNVQKTQHGELNFGGTSSITSEMVTEEPLEDTKMHTISELENIEEGIMLDFRGHILSMNIPYKWYNPENGRTFTRQSIVIVDVVERTSITVTLWENFITKYVIGEMFEFKGFRLRIFNNSRALTSTVYSTYNHVKDFDINPHVLENINFRSISHTFTPRKFTEIEGLLHGRQDREIFYTRTQVQVIKCVKEVPYYPGCALCSSKLKDDNYCQKCQKKVKPIIRLFFTLLVHDGESSIIVKCFHDISEKIASKARLDIEMEDIEKINSEKVFEEVSKLAGKRMTIGFSSCVENYCEEKYNNHTVIDLSME